MRWYLIFIQHTVCFLNPCQGSLKKKFSKNRWIKIIYHLEQWGILHLFNFCSNNGCISFFYWQKDTEHKQLFKFYVKEKNPQINFYIAFCENQFKQKELLLIYLANKASLPFTSECHDVSSHDHASKRLQYEFKYRALIGI